LKKFRVDYHVHPNLSRNNTKAVLQCKKWWEAVLADGLDCVIVTEHSYKNPKRAFELMNACKPEGVFCFPGLEYVTKEGIDIIIFSKDVSIYEKFKSFELTYFEVVDLVKSNDKFFSFVTHPYTLGLTSVLSHLSREEYVESVNTLGAVEISNGAFDNLKCLLGKFPFGFLFKNKISRIGKNQSIPRIDYPRGIKFLAAGSDAHHPESLGRCLEVKGDSVFEAIVGNCGDVKVITKDSVFDFLLLVKSGLTSLHEFLIKKKLRLYR